MDPQPPSPGSGFFLVQPMVSTMVLFPTHSVLLGSLGFSFRLLFLVCITAGVLKKAVEHR